MTPELDLHCVTASHRLMTRSGSGELRMPEFRNLHMVTIMTNISASGEFAPPLFIFKGTRLPYRTLVLDYVVPVLPLLQKCLLGLLKRLEKKRGYWHCLF